MKKIFTTMIVMLAFASVAFAQPRAIGGRLGWNTEFSYQHSITDGMYVDLTAGLGNAWSRWAYADVNASFDWVFNIKGIWNWFVGPAAGLGVGYGYYYRDYNLMPFQLNVGGQIGFEWEFGIPLNLTVDWRPMVNVLGFGSGYSGSWNKLYNFGVGLRYRFH